MSRVLLQWETWLYGLGAALIGGGAGAISTGVAQSVTDPGHADLHHLFALMGTSFGVAGLLSAAMYLKQSPLPTIISTNEEKTIEPTKSGGVVISTVSTTTTEPKG